MTHEGNDAADGTPHGRKVAEDALRASEARWRGLFEHMQEGFEVDELIYGPDGRAVDFRYLELNPAWERLTGIPRAAAVGRLLSEVIPDFEPFWLDTYARVVETGEPVQIERYVLPLGRWYEVLAHRAGPRQVAALIINVTERKRAEERLNALVELGDRLRDLHDAAGVAGAAAEIAGRTLGAVRAGYGVVDADADTIRVERDWTRGSAASVTGAHRLSNYWTGFADDLRRGEVVAIGDVASDPRTARHSASFAAIGARACVHVPVVEAGRVAAILYLHDAVPRAWTEEEVAFVHGVAERAWAAARRVQAEHRRTLLVNELNHRVKNTLAVVQSLAVYTARGTPDPASFAVVFQARLRALARAHDLLTREDWMGAAVGDVVRAALVPFAADATRLDLSACTRSVVLPPGAALSLAMALHELATNAVKYGALSVAAGRVSVACTTDPNDGAPVIEWLERGGPPVGSPPARQGFGLRLLERGLAAQAGMRADIRFEPEGVRCTIRLPPHSPSAAD